MIDADFQMMNAFKADPGAYQDLTGITPLNLSDENSEPEYCSLEGQMPDPDNTDTSFPPVNL
jgi:hypothetical protein